PHLSSAARSTEAKGLSRLPEVEPQGRYHPQLKPRHYFFLKISASTGWFYSFRPNLQQLS
ncbi:MAG: hypothetical protein WCK57_11100, partial [Verrucomicrobiae bacterium]